MKTTAIAACIDCPFRRHSQPGWLTGRDHHLLLEQPTRNALPCQEDTNEHQPHVCTGAAMMLNNMDHFSAFPDMARQQRRLSARGNPNRHDIFDSSEEFIRHHVFEGLRAHANTCLSRPPLHLVVSPHPHQMTLLAVEWLLGSLSLPNLPGTTIPINTLEGTYIDG